MSVYNKRTESGRCILVTKADQYWESQRYCTVIPQAPPCLQELFSSCLWISNSSLQSSVFPLWSPSSKFQQQWNASWMLALPWGNSDTQKSFCYKYHITHTFFCPELALSWTRGDAREWILWCNLWTCFLQEAGPQMCTGTTGWGFGHHWNVEHKTVPVSHAESALRGNTQLLTYQVPFSALAMKPSRRKACGVKSRTEDKNKGRQNANWDCTK